MKLLGCIAFILMCIAAQAAPMETLKVTGRMTVAARAELRRKVQAAGGCNANVCFAIDGSGSITKRNLRTRRTLFWMSFLFLMSIKLSKLLRSNMLLLSYPYLRLLRGRKNL
eukprot:IDg23105t1